MNAPFTPKQTVALPGVHEPGIYFGLDESAYHADPSLSTSGIKNLLVSPLDYWARSWMNPDRKETTSPFMEEGTAWHKRILEGRDAFYAAYAAELREGDVDGDLIVTVDDLKAECRERGLKLGGCKSELTARLLEADPEIATRLWSAVYAEHVAANAGKNLIAPDLIQKIELQAAMIEKHPDISRCFQGGYPEVSIFWVDPESGVPMKARLDYLKVRADIDLKTLSNPMAKPFDRAIYTAMATGRYHVQCAVYTEAMKAARDLIRAGAMHGEFDLTWLGKLADQNPIDRHFVFVFQQTGLAPIARAKRFPRSLVYDCAVISMRQQQRIWLQHWQTFGSDPWIDTTPIEDLEDEQFPVWMTTD